MRNINTAVSFHIVIERAGAMWHIFHVHHGILFFEKQICGLKNNIMDPTAHENKSLKDAPTLNYHVLVKTAALTMSKSKQLKLYKIQIHCRSNVMIALKLK